ncbi:DUF2062 domain-containing protein [Paenibacillus sp. CAA11]|nr:DUF2062 domain-containing protein [Paenibacillus sp. CAA11]
MINRIYRAFKLNIFRLFRTPGGVKKMSLGFSLGFGMEMIVISSACLVYLIFYPVVKLAGGSVPAAVIGNVIGKLTFLPIILMPFAKKLGEWVYPSSSSAQRIQEVSLLDIFKGDFSAVGSILHGGLHILIGMSIFGAVLGVISYYVIQFFYHRTAKRRQAKRRRKYVLSETA